VPKLLPASIGLSVLLPPGEGDAVQVTLHYAEYLPGTADETPEGRTKPPQQWQRVPRRPVRLRVALDAARLAKGEEIPGSDGLWLEGRLVAADAPGLARARAPSRSSWSTTAARHRERPRRHGLRLPGVAGAAPRGGLVPRPNRRDEGSDDPDDRIADLQYRDCVEWAVGHGVSTEALREGERVVGARTVWLPRAEVRPVVSCDLDAVTTEMDALAAMPDGAALRAALRPLVDAYGAWIDRAARGPLDTERRGETRDTLLARRRRERPRPHRRGPRAPRDARRPLRGLRAGQPGDGPPGPQARPRSATRRPPRWRLFQLAFLLLNVAGLHDPTHADRERVELIFFPTGGGKTEAYLGVIAFALVLRRMRGRARPDGGYGVTVLLRYTLRLLTLDQLQRAATLVCALETLRRDDPARLGDVRFSVGLWVGRTATANTLAEVGEKITDVEAAARQQEGPVAAAAHGTAPGAASSSTPTPPPSSPRRARRRTCACSARTSAAATSARATSATPRRACRWCSSTSRCTASCRRSWWRRWTSSRWCRGAPRPGCSSAASTRARGALLRHARQPRGVARAEVLPEGLRPPSSSCRTSSTSSAGPLGTMVGLYETAIEALCETALETAARAPEAPRLDRHGAPRARQILSLFGRDSVSLFPPPGLDEGDTFFARVDRAPTAASTSASRRADAR
jgi:hypothetical protein